MNKRARTLVNCAKEGKIMEPFAKMMKIRTDSVDSQSGHVNSDDAPMPRTIWNLETESIARTLVNCAKEGEIMEPFAKTMKIRTDSVDGQSGDVISDDAPMPRTIWNLEAESIAKDSTTTDNKTSSPDDCLEKENYTRKRTLSSSSSSSSCSSCSSSSSSSSNSSNTNNSTARISSLLNSQPSTSNHITILQTETSILQPQSPVRNEPIPQLNTSKLDSIQSSKQTDNADNMETDNIARDLESTDCGDFSPDDSGDDYLPEKRGHARTRTRTLTKSRTSALSSLTLPSSSTSDSDSTASDSILIQRQEFTSQQDNGSHPPVSNSSINPIPNDFSPQLCMSQSNVLNNEISRDVQNSDLSPSQNRKKRMRNEADWIKSKTKRLKNSGQQYISRSGKTVLAKEMKPPCSEKCRTSCSKKFTDQQRRQIFEMYWALSSLQRQRDFLNSAVSVLELPQRRVKTGVTKNKKPNTYCCLVNNGKNLRVCKTFLLNTLGIADRTLRTVIENKTKDDFLGTAPSDKRGKHGKQSKTDPEVLESVRTHINSITRIESHYLRANTTREFIDGGLTIADLHRDYKKIRESSNKVAATYDLYFRIFNNEFNISFFVPKKDQCDVCESFKNAIGDDKENLTEYYNEHLRQKEFSRLEKKKDIEACKTAESNEIVAIYDLQAVMPVPIGESSAFFYKSKLNCLNLTVTDIKNKRTVCYFWHEALGSRGANEIGSCVFKFLQDVAEKHPDSDVTFYTDNCGGQQKNRFIFSMYLYAVTTLRIKSITQKFLIRGHTQNEGDTAHSIIEKAIKKSKRSGPIYVPDQYVQIIRSAKKNGSPFAVEELNYDDFYDLKKLADEVGLNTGKDVQRNTIKVNDIKMIQFKKDSATYSYKTKYEEEWTKVELKTRSRTKSARLDNEIKDINLKAAYSSRIDISQNKKNDLQELLKKNIIPKYYSSFYESILTK